MEKREVFVPLMSWLIGGSRIGGSYNTYSGSLGTDPEKGIFGQRIFNYRILIEKNEEDEEFIRVVTFYGLSSFDTADEDELETNLFEATEEGRAQAEAYLQQKADDFFAD